MLVLRPETRDLLLSRPNRPLHITPEQNFQILSQNRGYEYTELSSDTINQKFRSEEM